MDFTTRNLWNGTYGMLPGYHSIPQTESLSSRKGGVPLPRGTDEQERSGRSIQNNIKGKDLDDLLLQRQNVAD